MTKKDKETAEPRSAAEESLRSAPEGGVDNLSAAEHVTAAMANIRAHADKGVLSRKEERLIVHLDNVKRMLAQRG